MAEHILFRSRDPGFRQVNSESLEPEGFGDQDHVVSLEKGVIEDDRTEVLFDALVRSPGRWRDQIAADLWPCSPGTPSEQAGGPMGLPTASD